MFLEFLLLSRVVDYIDNIEYNMKLQQAENDNNIDDSYNELNYLRNKVERLESEKYKNF